MSSHSRTGTYLVLRCAACVLPACLHGLTSGWPCPGRLPALPSRRSVFGLPIIRPHNGLALLWTLAIVLLDVVYTAFWVPMNVAFCTAEYANPSSSCTKSDLVGGALYTINVLLSFQVSGPGRTHHASPQPQENWRGACGSG